MVMPPSRLNLKIGLRTSSAKSSLIEKSSPELEDLSRAVHNASQLVGEKLRAIQKRRDKISEEGSASPVPALRTHLRHCGSMSSFRAARGDSDDTEEQ